MGRPRKVLPGEADRPVGAALGASAEGAGQDAGGDGVESFPAVDLRPPGYVHGNGEPDVLSKAGDGPSEVPPAEASPSADPEREPGTSGDVRPAGKDSPEPSDSPVTREVPGPSVKDSGASDSDLDPGDLASSSVAVLEALAGAVNARLAEAEERCARLRSLKSRVSDALYGRRRAAPEPGRLMANTRLLQDAGYASALFVRGQQAPMPVPRGGKD
jgi:hypothetical protein